MSAESVFRAASDSKRMMLERIWPELHAALLGNAPSEAERGHGPAPIDPPNWHGEAMPCFAKTHAGIPTHEKPKATGRLWRNGPMACARCIQSFKGVGAHPSGLGWPLPYLPPGRDE